MSATTIQLSRRRNALARHRGADDPATLEADRELHAAQLEERIQQALASAPPLTPAQRRRLARMIHPGVTDGS